MIKSLASAAAEEGSKIIVPILVVAAAGQLAGGRGAVVGGSAVVRGRGLLIQRHGKIQRLSAAIHGDGGGIAGLKLAQGASLLEMTRYGVAAGSAATINQGTRLCSLADTQKIVDYLSRN